jgi:hypothetical protein
MFNTLAITIVQRCSDAILDGGRAMPGGPSVSQIISMRLVAFSSTFFAFFALLSLLFQ